jgi:hypothetical protein
MRNTLVLAAIAALAFASAADAKNCKDAAGKFVRCPAPAVATAPAKVGDVKTATKTAKCKDAKGHFAKCTTTTTTSVMPAAPASTPVASTTSMTPAGKKAPHCVKGKACGNSCIKMTDVCHK